MAQQRDLRQVWVGGQSFQYDANGRYPDNDNPLADLRVDKIIVKNRTVEERVFNTTSAGREGMGDFLSSAAARNRGNAHYLANNFK